MAKRISGRIAAHGKKCRVEFGKQRSPIRDAQDQARADLVRLRYVPVDRVEREMFAIKTTRPEPKMNDREVAVAWRNLCLRLVEKFAPMSSEVMEDLTAAEAACLSECGLFNPLSHGHVGDNELDGNHMDDQDGNHMDDEGECATTESCED